MKWFHDGVLIEGDRIQNNGDGRYTLTIPSMASADFGEYTVTVTYDRGVFSCSATIRQTVFEFRKRFYGQTIAEGAQLVLEIEVDGEPTEIKVGLYQLMYQNLNVLVDER